MTRNDDDDLSDIDFGEFKDIPDRKVVDRESGGRCKAIILMSIMAFIVYVVVSQPALLHQLLRSFGVDI